MDNKIILKTLRPILFLNPIKEKRMASIYVIEIGEACKLPCSKPNEGFLLSLVLLTSCFSSFTLNSTMLFNSQHSIAFDNVLATTLKTSASVQFFK